MALTPRDYRRALRRHATPAERRLWSIVRANRLGLHVRRQHTIGPYTVDLYCAAARLAIEIDGSIHDDPARAAYDAACQRALESHGLHVLRFSNDDVLTQPEAVVAAILHAARQRTPLGLPAAYGERYRATVAPLPVPPVRVHPIPGGERGCPS